MGIGVISQSLANFNNKKILLNIKVITSRNASSAKLLWSLQSLKKFK